jgi:hypothetical protein
MADGPDEGVAMQICSVSFGNVRTQLGLAGALRALTGAGYHICRVQAKADAGGTVVTLLTPAGVPFSDVVACVRRARYVAS